MNFYYCDLLKNSWQDIFHDSANKNYFFEKDRSYQREGGGLK